MADILAEMGSKFGQNSASAVGQLILGQPPSHDVALQRIDLALYLSAHVLRASVGNVGLL